MSQRNAEHRFYKGKQLQLIVSQQHVRQVFGMEDLALAERHIVQGEAKNFRIATQAQKSLISAISDGGVLPVADGCYGFNNHGHNFITGFTGQMQDKISGCYILGNGYRAYSPGLMRFLAPDSASPFGKGGINSYAYCVGDPVNYRDDTGHSPWSRLLKSKSTIQRRDEALAAINRQPLLKKYKPIAEKSINNKELRYIKNLEKAQSLIKTIKSTHDAFVEGLPPGEQKTYKNDTGQIRYDKLGSFEDEIHLVALHAKERKYTSVLDNLLPAYSEQPSVNQSIATTSSAQPTDGNDMVRKKK
ncbi:RHS repeat-associated core domain-containing protein [Pseudomonas xanthosomatis]|uniref:RHS repeat-associated core domain-containing protein n=1 Tax=Pseudomonas xanthosomatis TaxID=2842356 RepID=UPI0035170D30